MTDDKNSKSFKKLVRARMEQTGERYTTAMAALQAQRNGAPPSLEDKMRGRPPPPQEAFDKAFGQTKASGEGEMNGGRFAIENVECVQETDDGLYCKGEFFSSRNHDGWVPKGQVHSESDVTKKGDKGNLIVTAWLARQRSWST